jgi:hypothetical protein
MPMRRAVSMPSAATGVASSVRRALLSASARIKATDAA